MSDVAARRVPRSPTRDELLIPQTQLVITQRCLFSEWPPTWAELFEGDPPVKGLSSPFYLVVIGLGALPSSFIKRRYISSQSEWMNTVCAENKRNSEVGRLVLPLLWEALGTYVYMLIIQITSALYCRYVRVSLHDSNRFLLKSAKYRPHQIVARTL